MPNPVFLKRAFLAVDFLMGLSLHPMQLHISSLQLRTDSWRCHAIFLCQKSFSDVGLLLLDCEDIASSIVGESSDLSIPLHRRGTIAAVLTFSTID